MGIFIIPVINLLYTLYKTPWLKAKYEQKIIHCVPIEVTPKLKST